MPNLITRIIPVYMNLWHFIGVLFKKVITNNQSQITIGGKSPDFPPRPQNLVLHWKEIDIKAKHTKMVLLILSFTLLFLPRPCVHAIMIIIPIITNPINYLRIMMETREPRTMHKTTKQLNSRSTQQLRNPKRMNQYMPFLQRWHNRKDSYLIWLWANNVWLILLRQHSNNVHLEVYLW